MKVTVDTSVLVYAADVRSGPKHQLASALLARAAHAKCVLTLQSLGEFYAVSTRKRGLTHEQALGFVVAWRRVFDVVLANESCFYDAIELSSKHRIPFWDAMLWATASTSQCKFLLSEDGQDGRRWRSLTIIDPFKPANTGMIEAILPVVH